VGDGSSSVGGVAFLVASGISLTDAGTGGEEGFTAFDKTFPNGEPPAAAAPGGKLKGLAAGALAGTVCRSSGNI
jgi:hypothetical protein